ncbi:adenosylcobinamide-GDP ribazoletransferase [soil metagenome]
MITDALRLAVGTLTVLRVPPAREFNRRVAGAAMVMAPVAVVPLGIAVGLTLWLGGELSLPSYVTAVLAVGLLALGSRALHLDGLADTADALTASYDPTRSLEVMRTGNTGPAGVAALVFLLLLQVAALASFAPRSYGWLLAGVMVCCSRAAVAATCMSGVPPARDEGLGSAFAGTVARVSVALVVAAVTVVAVLGFVAADLPWWRGVIAVGAASFVVGLLLIRSVKRFGGVTGDTFGAAIELALAALLVVASAP